VVQGKFARLAGFLILKFNLKLWLCILSEKANQKINHQIYNFLPEMIKSVLLTYNLVILGVCFLEFVNDIENIV
jgi:hypothetical protein